MLSLSDLPAFNAFMNATASLCLFLGFWAIKTQRKKLHQKAMLAALIFSAIFLISYLTYHFYHPTTKFPELGWVKTLYLTILFSHIILAVVMLPMIIMTFFRAFKKDFVAHKRIAKPTFIIWSYVSVTGVLIYFMLYQWFHP